MKIVVFAGTTEGKQAAMLFGSAGHDVVVTVATDYGRQVFEESLKGQNIQLLEGRLNQSQMRELIRHQDLVVDATHPYAVEVSHNIVAACQEENKNYLRILRDHEQEQDYQDVILPMENIQQVIDWLNQHSGKVLLTTGSKDLKTYAQIHDYHNRLYPRILADINSLEMAMDQGYKKSNIICMQGPFTTQINVAMLEMIGASYLVTKETGGSGGYLQKLEACKELGIRAIVIKRPVEEIEKISKSQNLDEKSWRPTETTTETITENKIENKIENTAEKSNNLMTGVSLKILESYLYAHSDVDLTALQAYQEEIENQKNDSSHALKEDAVQNNTMDSKSSKSGSLKQQDNNQDNSKETSGKAQELEDLKLREMTQVTVPQVDFVNPPRFPIFLNLKDHLVTVIGSGNIARRRIKALLSYGAKVRVISPHASDNLQMAGILDWEKDKAQGYSGSIQAIDRAYQENDLEGAVLAVAATNNRQVNHQVYEEAQHRGIFVSVADKKEESSYYFPALWTGEGLSVGIVGDGENHSYVKKSAQTIRNALDEIQFGKKEKE